VTIAVLGSATTRKSDFVFSSQSVIVWSGVQDAISVVVRTYAVASS